MACPLKTLFNERELQKLAQRPFQEILDLPYIDYKIKYLVENVRLLHIISGIGKIKPPRVYQKPIELFNGEKLNLTPTKEQDVTWAIFRMNWCRFQNRAIPIEFLMNAAASARAAQGKCITELSENLEVIDQPELYKRCFDGSKLMDSVGQLLDEIDQKLYNEKKLFLFHWEQK